MLFSKTPKKKEFTFGDMHITLSDEFVFRNGANGVEIVSNKALISVQNFLITPASTIHTIDDFIDFLIEAGKNRNLTFVKEPKFGSNCIEAVYIDQRSKKPYHLLTFAFKTDKAFWQVVITTHSLDHVSLRGEIMQWIQSIKFDS